MTLTLDAVTWTPENGVVKATGDDIIVHDADDRPADWPNGPRESVMDAFYHQGAGCAIGYHGLLSQPVAETFCNNFWWMASRQCNRYGEPRETTIEDAFVDAADLSGMPGNWELVGLGTAERVRPAHYRGNGQ